MADANADVNLTDPDGTTALVLAIINSQYHVASYLLSKRGRPKYCRHHGNGSALRRGRHQYAAGDVELIRQLLDHGANPNAALTGALLQHLHTDGDSSLGEGSTAFLRAAKSGDGEVMRILRAHGANPKAVNKGWSDRGSDDEVIAAIRLCLKNGVDINSGSGRGKTAVHAAITGRGSDDILRFLAANGANIEAKNAQGRTPLEVATASRKDRASNVAILRSLLAGQTH